MRTKCPRWSTPRSILRSARGDPIGETSTGGAVCETRRRNVAGRRSENVNEAPLSSCDINPGGAWSSNAHSICGAVGAFSQRTVMIVCLSWLAGTTMLILRNSTARRLFKCAQVVLLSPDRWDVGYRRLPFEFGTASLWRNIRR